MKASLILELDLEEAAALYHLIGHCTSEELINKTMSHEHAEKLKRIHDALPAFGPPSSASRTPR